MGTTTPNQGAGVAVLVGGLCRAGANCPIARRCPPCDSSSEAGEPDGGDIGDPLAPSAAGSIVLYNDGAQVDTSATLELRFAPTDADFVPFSQSHQIDSADMFPFEYALGGGFADPRPS